MATLQNPVVADEIIFELLCLKAAILTCPSPWYLFLFIIVSFLVLYLVGASSLFYAL